MPENISERIPEQLSEKRLGGCTLGGAIAVTSFISDAVTVVHAPKGCAHQVFSMLHALVEEASLPLLPPLLSSDMSDREVIFGGEEALSLALDKAAAKNPALIITVSSCVTETIGDDSEKVCRAHPAADKIITLPTAGFLGGRAEDGENTALLALATLAEKCVPLPKTAAIIGEKNLETEVEENYAEVERLLSRLGISVTLRFCRNIQAAEIGKLGEASFFIIRDERVFPAGAAVAKRFDRPYVAEFPRGLSGCVTFLRDAGHCARIPEEGIERAVRDEEAYQKQMLEPFEEMRGSSVYLGAQLMEGTFDAAREAMERLGIREAPDGIPLKLPFYLPVGVSGMMKMLYLWRRRIRG
ncbi:MAG TPA: oxidoreductase [Methanocorpusculum sp.]|nr:oxidoreductase [Candidatus Methanocorpusculum equi]MCQ2357667.1 oxidoreductase [Methanocorpusculum sp.]HJJ33648.1 oxidoreductase [Methanocorpusculum sp.]HJJ44678.1 oxidoreductase [Methanocorpusculum sp.]HJJ58567.1 oxidoreductase [Methanocorpusculum sp.]